MKPYIITALVFIVISYAIGAMVFYREKHPKTCEEQGGKLEMVIQKSGEGLTVCNFMPK